MTNVLVTGGAGFIGSNFVRYALVTHPDWHVTTLDVLTYAGNIGNLDGVLNHPRHRFVRGDICDMAVSGPLVEQSDIVVHFAAESHVDRSIRAVMPFLRTNVEGTGVLLDAARRAPKLRRFLQVSTDEVYGSVDVGSSVETDELLPRNPYAASKAGAERLAYSYWVTHGVPVVISRGSNTYGPHQYPEKAIPAWTTSLVAGRPLRIFGDGTHVRDWMHVDDHCRALDRLLTYGLSGQVYNIGGGCERTNTAVAQRILSICGRSIDRIAYVQDRPGHDKRYSLNTAKLRALGWSPRMPFEQGLRDTVEWYRTHPEWWANEVVA